MNKNDIKLLWREAHSLISGNFLNEENFRETLRMSHSKIISKVLSDIKLKIFGYSLGLILFIGLMIYALVYLGLLLSLNTLVLFSFIGLFLIIKTSSEITRLSVLTKTANNLSIKESVFSFRKRLNKIRTVDFVSYLIYFYTLAIWSIYIYTHDIGGVKNLYWGNAFQILLLIAILIILLIPWLIKFQHNQRYKKLYSNLDDSANFFNEAN
jgi:hypothetical protein